eukprot:jgi/Psemu1/4187/gm1.4187_g
MLLQQAIADELGDSITPSIVVYYFQLKIQGWLEVQWDPSQAARKSSSVIGVRRHIPERPGSAAYHKPSGGNHRCKESSYKYCKCPCNQMLKQQEAQLPLQQPQHGIKSPLATTTVTVIPELVLAVMGATSAMSSSPEQPALPLSHAILPVPTSYYHLHPYPWDRLGIHIKRVTNLPHPTAHLLEQFRKVITPAKVSTPPWLSCRIKGALLRDPCKSSHQGIEFLCKKYTDMMDKQQWTVLPAHLIKKFHREGGVLDDFRLQLHWRQHRYISLGTKGDHLPVWLTIHAQDRSLGWILLTTVEAGRHHKARTAIPYLGE